MNVEHWLKVWRNKASRREYCPSDVMDSLQKNGIEASVAQRIIDTLKKEGYIDTIRFAKAFVNDKHRFNRWGKRRLKMELRQRGIDEEIIDEALQRIDESGYLVTLDRLLEEKLRSLRETDQRALLYKMTTFATNKGYEPALARERAGMIINQQKQDL